MGGDDGNFDFNLQSLQIKFFTLKISNEHEYMNNLLIITKLVLIPNMKFAANRCVDSDDYSLC